MSLKDTEAKNISSSAPIPETDKSASGTAAVLISVKLEKAHTHAGKDYPANAKIDVTADLRAWLIKHGVVKDPAAASQA